MQKIKTGDVIKVLAGKDKGKQGSVSKIIYNKNYPKKILKVIVKGVNLFKKHKKGDPANNSPGAILSKEMPIDISNVALLNPANNRPSKVGFRFIEQEQGKKKKVRYFKSNQEVIDG